MATPVPLESPLLGRQVLIVEDDCMTACEIDPILKGDGVKVIGPASCVTDALRLVAVEGRINAAVLDVNVDGQRFDPWPTRFGREAQG